MKRERCASHLTWVLVLTTAVMVTQARPTGQEGEDEELALSDLHGDLHGDLQGQPGDPKPPPPVSPEEQSLLNSELEALKSQEAAKSLPGETESESLSGEEGGVLEVPRPKEGVEEVVGDAGEDQEDAGMAPPPGDAVDEEDISWANMGYSPETLRAIGNMVREVERNLLTKRIRSEQGRLRETRQLQQQLQLQQQQLQQQKRAEKKDVDALETGPQGQAPQGMPGGAQGAISAHVRRRRSTGGVRLPYAV